jgi:hypothetical protein
MKPNQDIRRLIRESHVCSWQVAEHLRIGENTFYRLLRRKLTKTDRERISAAIEAIKIQNFDATEEKETV